MPLNIITTDSGPTVDATNACCGSLDRLEIMIPLNQAKLKFRIRFQSDNRGWSKWSAYTTFRTRNKDYKRPGKNPARDGVTFTDRGATVIGDPPPDC